MSSCRLCFVCCMILAGLTAGGAIAQTDPFICDNQALVVQDDGTGNSAILSRAIPHNYDPDRFVFTTVAPNPLNMGPPGFGFDANAIGFSRANGLIWGWKPVSGSAEVFMVDNAGTLTGWGVPMGAMSLTNTFLGNAGDVNVAGDTLYVTQRASGPLYTISLPANPAIIAPLSATEITLTRPDTTPINFAVDGIAADLAARNDGLLYGGDHTHGEIVVIDPATGVRTDFAVVGGPLPTGSQFGGAWFDASFSRLYLLRNSGSVIQVDITAGPTFTLVAGTVDGPGSLSKNDGTACVNEVIGAAKRMTADMTSGLVTIELFFENLTPLTALDGISAIDDLTGVFGTAGVDWNFLSISSDVPGFHNTLYDGSAVTQLVAPMQSLGGMTATATITVTIGLENLNPAPSDPPDPMLPNATFCNHVFVTGTLASGPLANRVFGDFSTDASGGIGMPLDPDPNSDGAPIEDAPSCTQTTTTPVELQHFSIE